MKWRSAAPVLLMVVFLGAGSSFPAQLPEAPPPASSSQAQTSQPPQQGLSPEQLENLVAPIALYPDPLLGQILVASTYPLEVVEAQQWLQRNRNLRGQALINAAKEQSWDPSIQALVAVPDALAKLNQDIRWTTDLGNSFLAQQAEVMEAVQRMRARAKEQGRLASTPQQTVTTQEEGGKQIVVIQPSNPQVIYVPAYDPYWVWGPPAYGYYPPLYYPSFGFGFGIGYDFSFYFGGWGGWGSWGWGPSWFGHSVYVNRAFFNYHGYHHGYGGGYPGPPVWAHNPIHRQRVPYANPHLASQFGRGSMGPGQPRAGARQISAASSYTTRYQARPAGGAPGQGSRNTSPQVPRFQNPPRERYQTAYSNRLEPRAQQNPGRSQQGYQAPPQVRSESVQARQSPRAVSFGNPSRQGIGVAQRYNTAPQAFQQTQRFQAQPQMRAQAPAQQFRSMPQMRAQAPAQQFRSAPQMPAPRFSGGGSSSRGGFGGFGGGGGGRRP